MRYYLMRYPEGKFKALTLSYDDGSIHDERFIEILNKYGIKTTLNINGASIKNEDDWHINPERLKAFKAQGHEIAVHGYNHIAPGMVNSTAGIKDVLDCRRSLEQYFGTIIRGMAYPDSGIRRMANGANYDNIKGYLKDLGIVYSRTLGGENKDFDLPQDWYNWTPTLHHNHGALLDWLKEFTEYQLPDYEPRRASKLFYMWGHSFEFENDGTWDTIERFCAEASGKDDIWYATNIEIYDYCEAYSRLQFSADMDTVYNPTLYDIWIEVDKKLYCVKSGETIRV